MGYAAPEQAANAEAVALEQGDCQERCDGVEGYWGADVDEGEEDGAD